MGQPATVIDDRDQIVQFVLARATQAEPMNARAVLRSDPPLYYAALRRFGCWNRALRAAGLNPDRITHSRKWDHQRIIAHIRQLAWDVRSLRRCEILRRDPGLVTAAQTRFGSWSAALSAAGVELPPRRLSSDWHREQILEAILLRAVKQEALGSTTVRPYSLKTAAVAEFGSWFNALSAAGLNPVDHTGHAARKLSPNASPTYESPEAVKRALLQRDALGLVCRYTTIKRQDYRLFRAIRRYFGSCTRALQFTGITTDAS